MTRTGARGRVAGLYAVTPDIGDTPALLAKVEAALGGGARIVQYRNKKATHELRVLQAGALQRLCDRYGAIFIVNDHVDVALAVNAQGAHIGAEDGSLAAARKSLGVEKIIGVSCYDAIDRAREAERAGADYVAFGSFFPSQVKPAAVRAPVDLLAQAKRELSVPIVAIGGITCQNAPELIAAGADAVAVISALFDARDVAGEARRFAELFSRS